MFNYLAFVHSGIQEAQQNARFDGRQLASDCFAQLQALDNPEQFPPRLLILMASPEYLETDRAQALLDGIHEVCIEHGQQELALIGSSVSAVFFNRQTYDRGALLICLASRLLTVELAVNKKARIAPQLAVESILKDLKLGFFGQDQDPNPLVDRLLFTFMPGFGSPGSGLYYPGPDIHSALRKQMLARVPIVGGCSSANSRDREGLQFAGNKVLVDSIVAAKLTTGFPFTSSIGHGLTQTGDFFQIEELEKDRRTILKFKQGIPAEVLSLTEPEDFRLMGELSLDHDPLITVVRPVKSVSGAVGILRELPPSSSLELLRPEPNRMRQEAKKLIDWSLKRLHIERPAGIIGIHCSAWRTYGPTIADLIDDAQQISGVDAQHYVGGFFDGEIGVGQNAQSLFGNWSLSRLCLGDEMRQRTPYYRGFDAMATMSQKLARVNSLEEAVRHSLELVHQIGYPGAMLSFLQWNEDERWLVPSQAIGSRYERVVREMRDQAKRPVSQDDLFAKIAEGTVDPYILDTQNYEGKEFEAFKGLNLHTQYIKPIRNFKNNSQAFLQIDLGDWADKKQLPEEEKRIIDSISLIVEATLMRLVNRIEANIAHQLDEALVECQRLPNLQKALCQYIERAAKIFGADMGNVRLAREEDKKLVLVAGVGQFYEAQRYSRELLPMDYDSPTAKAFHRDLPLVVNDARNNPSFQRLLGAYADQILLFNCLAEIGSYANVAFKDEHETRIGTVNLISRQPWFFTRPLVKSLELMGRRISQLVEHFRKQNQQKFLAEINTVYEYTEERENLPEETLRDTVRRCREVANAEIALLFIWEEDLGKYVLYAQDGWDEKWVNAAGYGVNDRWTGQIALDLGKPLYIPDVYQFKQKHGSEKLLRYFDSMFGMPFTASSKVESLVLPLRLKSKASEARESVNIFSHSPMPPRILRNKSELKFEDGQKPLGVFTLYRKVNLEKAGQGEGFAVTDPKVLRAAADSLAVMVSGQKHRENSRLEREDEKRRNSLVKSFSRNDRGGIPEDLLCKDIERSFKASQVVFHIINQEHNLEAAAASPTGRLLNLQLNGQCPDEMVLLALKDKRPQLKKSSILKEDLMKPELAKKEGCVERLCLPLLHSKKPIGVLDIRWAKNQLPDRKTIRREWLLRWMKTLSDTYFKQKNWIKQEEVKRQTELNRLAAQTMGMMMFQSTHRVVNLVQELRAVPNLLMAASDKEREELIKDLVTIINSATERIKQPMEVARQARNPEPQKSNLSRLINRSLESVPGRHRLTINLEVNDSLTAWVDPNLIEEAFFNIIQNAVKVMPDGGHLTIKATLIRRGAFIRIEFADNGPGMSREQAKSALMGFNSQNNSTGMGLLISTLLVTGNNGTLKIDPKPGQGTSVIITLPAESKEKNK